MSHVYVERADPDAKGYEPLTRRWFNVIDRYQWADKYVKGITIDVPCGMGWGTSCVRNADTLIGVDKCYEALEKGRNRYTNITFILGDMLNLPFKDNFADAIICCEGYEHLNREDQFFLMGELFRAVKPDGLVLLTVPIAKHKEEHTGNKFHLYEPTLDEVTETLSRFEIMSMIKPNVARYLLRPIK